MTSVTSFRLVLIAGLAAPMIFATAAFAQPAPQPGGQPAAEMRRRPDPAEMRARMADRLRAVLQLQPSQETALNAFLDALKPPAGERDRMRQDRAADERLTTPARLDKMLARMDARRTRFAQVASATKTFYAQLSPAQQRDFDASMPVRGMGGGRGDDHGAWRGRDRDGPHEMGPDGPPPR